MENSSMRWTKMKKTKLNPKHLYAIFAFLLSAVVVFCGVQIWQEYSSRQKDIDAYAPHRGYIDWGFSGRTLLHTGKYIKYPKNSNCQRWIKRETSLRIRRCRDVPAKGNYYRRLFDYWWTLY